MTAKELIANFKAWESKGNKLTQTVDPALLAGGYLDWASGDIDRAISTLEVHVSGQYLDMPRFLGCDVACEILKSVRTAAPSSQVH